MSKAKRAAGGIFNLVNYLLGAGILGLGYAFDKAGILGGILLLVLCTAMTGLSLLYLIRAAESSGCFSYEELSQRFLFRGGARVVSVIIILDTLSSLAAYIRIVDDGLLSVLNGFQGFQDMTNAWHGIPTACAVAIFIVPFMWLRDLHWLSVLSFISLLPSIFLLGVLCAHVGTETPRPLFNDQPLLAFPIMVFALYTHLAVLPIYQGLYTPEAREVQEKEEKKEKQKQKQEEEEQNSKRKEIRWIVFWSVALSFVAYLVAGLFSFLIFGDGILPNMISNFHQWYLVALVITNSLAILIGFPMVLYACRLSLHELLRPWLGACSYRLFVMENLFILILAFVIGIETPKLTDLLGLSGALFKTLLAFALPPFFYLVSVRPALPGKILALILLATGCILGPLSFVVTLRNSI